nr:ankyrin repeat and KH domain containing protein [Hymenolepis microstoma]
MSQNIGNDSSVCSLETDFDRFLVLDKEESFEFGNFSTIGEYRPHSDDSFLNAICEWPEKESETILERDVQPQIAPNEVEFMETTFTKATRTKDLVLMSDCIRNDPRIIDQQNAFGFTALHYAAKDGFIEGVNFLLESHCNLDQQNCLGWTPLMVAIYNRHFDIANQLLDAGASPYLLNHEFESAITLAASQSEYQLLNRIVNTPSDCKELRDQVLSFALIHAAVKQNIALANAILESGADLYFCLPNQMPPLNISAGNGFDILVRRLITAGAPLESRDKLGLTPLMQAASSGHLFICQLLIFHGADVHAVRKNETAKDMAVAMGHREIAQYLQNLME